MEFNLYAEIIAAFAGAGIWGIVHYFIKRGRAEPLDQYAVKLLQDEIFELRQRTNMIEGYNAGHVKKIAELEKENFELKHQIEIMKFAPFSIPLPMWMKNSFGIVDFVNDEFEKAFLLPRGYTKDDYLGRTDHAVWPNEIAKEYRQNDEAVMNTGATFNGREPVPNGIGSEENWRIMIFNRKVPAGVARIAFPDNGYFDVYFKNKKK